MSTLLLILITPISTVIYISAMTDEEIFSAIRDIMCKRLEKDESDITEKSNLKDLGIDSLMFFDIVMDTEERLNVNIPDNIEAQPQTVADIVEIVKKIVEESK